MVDRWGQSARTLSSCAICTTTHQSCCTCRNTQSDSVLVYVEQFLWTLVSSLAHQLFWKVINLGACKVIMRCILLTSSGCEQLSDTCCVTRTGLALECGHYKYFTTGSYSVQKLYNQYNFLIVMAAVIQRHLLPLINICQLFIQEKTVDSLVQGLEENSKEKDNR